MWRFRVSTVDVRSFDAGFVTCFFSALFMIALFFRAARRAGGRIRLLWPIFSIDFLRKKNGMDTYKNERNQKKSFRSCYYLRKILFQEPVHKLFLLVMAVGILYILQIHIMVQFFSKWIYFGRVLLLLRELKKKVW